MKISTLDFLPSNLRHIVAHYTPAPDPTTPRNYTQEQKQQLAGAQATAPGYLALNQQYNPQYTQLGLQDQALQQFGNGSTPGTSQLNAAAASYQRGSDVSDVMNLGPGVTAAQLNANPFLGQGLTNLASRLPNSQILNTLNSQANSALNSGGALSDSDVRNLQQQTRAGFADRGMVMGNQELGTELLNRDTAQRSRLAAAQQFASGVQGLNAQQNQFAQGATGTFATALADPFNVLLGRSGGASGASNQQGSAAGGASSLYSPSNPTSNQYANSLFSANQQAQYANNVNSANATNSNIGTYAGIAAALLSDERIKKDIKDTGDKTRDGIPIKTFRYKTDKKKRKFLGVMAGDVEKKRPDAIVRDPLSGLRAVKYGMIGAPFKQLLAA